MRGEYYFYKLDGVYHRLDVRDVSHIEARDNYVWFHTRLGEKHEVRAPFHFILQRTSGLNFVQINRSFAVSLDHILVITPDSVILNTQPENREVTISKSFYDVFLENVILLEPGKQGCDHDCDREVKPGSRKWKEREKWKKAIEEEEARWNELNRYKENGENGTSGEI